MSDMDDKMDDVLEKSGDANSDGSGKVQDSSEQKYVTLEQFQEWQEAQRRANQSNKDKAVAKVNQRLDSFESYMAELRSAKEKGLSVEDLIEAQERNERASLDEDIRFIAQKLRGEQGVSLAGNPSNGHAQKVVESLGLDKSDSRVATFATKAFASEAEAALEAVKLVNQIQTKKPTDADLPAGQTKSQRHDIQEQLMAEYNEGSKNLFGAQLIDFKMQMRKKGLDIS